MTTPVGVGAAPVGETWSLWGKAYARLRAVATNILRARIPHCRRSERAQKRARRARLPPRPALA